MTPASAPIDRTALILEIERSGTRFIQHFAAHMGWSFAVTAALTEKFNLPLKPHSRRARQSLPPLWGDNRHGRRG